MSLDEASGDELKAFWEKHAQMKQELGTQDSYHKSKQDSKYESTAEEKSTDHKSDWSEIGRLRDAGKWADAWAKIKEMPKIAEKTKTDPFMKKYWDLNEAGHYKKAHDLMVTYKIEKYGADVVKAWGMEYTSPWAPVVHLQNKGDYKQAWEKMKEMPEFQAKLEKNPEMQSFVDLNESGEYEAAFEEMIMAKIKKYGLETLENWGYELEPYFERSPWAPVIKLQAEGFLAEAWELMKELPEFQEKMTSPWIQSYYDQNEAGNYQEAHDSMMQWKIKEYGEDLVKAWGYDISKYVEDDATEQEGKPWYASKWSEEKWAEKKKMMEAFEETGMKNLFKDMMTEDFMEDIVGVIENMGGPDAIKEKISKWSTVDMSEHKTFKANEKAAFTISTKLSTLGVMGHIMSDQTQRASLDTLAKVAKVLPDATTCPSYSDGLSCFISSHLMTTPYDVEAPWPHEIMESFMEAGLLHMTGTGTQSVLKMPNLSAKLSKEKAIYERKQVSATATLVAARLAMTDGSACLESEFIEGHNHSHFDLDLTSLDWSHEDAIEFHKKNSPIKLTDEQREMLTVQIWGQDIRPTEKVLVPATRKAFEIIDQLQSVQDDEEKAGLLAKLGANSQCAIIFDENVPAWPSCNPLDNGQFGYETWKQKNRILKETEHTWGQKVDLDVNTLQTLAKINEQLIDVRYKKAMSKMEVPCLYRNPKQCFVVVSDPITNKIVSHPIDILDWETCQESYGEASCKESYYVKCDPTRVVDHVGAPLLCAENGSITLRAIAGEMVDDEYRSFHAGNYNVQALGAHMLNLEAWADALE